MAHATDAPKSSGWVAIRVCAIVLCALQLGQAAHFFYEGALVPALLITTCVIAGIVLSMISLLRPSHEVMGHMNGATVAPGTALAHDEGPRALSRFDYKVSLSISMFFLSVAISGIARSGTLLSLSAAIGLLGLAVALTLGVRDLRRRRRLTA